MDSDEFWKYYGRDELRREDLIHLVEKNQKFYGFKTSSGEKPRKGDPFVFIDDKKKMWVF